MQLHRALNRPTLACTNLLIPASQVTDGRAKFECSSGEGKDHNSHVEEDVRGVPGQVTSHLHPRARMPLALARVAKRRSHLAHSQIRALFSPTKLEMKPKKLRAYVRQQKIDGQDIVITEDLKKSLLCLQKSHARRKSREVLGDAKRGTYGALSTVLEKMDKVRAQ